VGEELSLTMYFFTAGPTQIYTSQPFSLHCNKKSNHVAGDHHGSRQNIRLVRTERVQFLCFCSLIEKSAISLLLCHLRKFVESAVSLLIAFALWLLCAYFEEPNNKQEYSMVNFTKSTRTLKNGF